MFNAVPMRRDFRVPTWAMRIIVQRRLGLPLDEALASGEPTRTARGGRVQDPMGHNQRTPPDRAAAACAHHAGRVGHAGRDGAAGSPRILERLPARRLWPGARQGAHAALYRRRQVQGPPLIPTRGGHRAAWHAFVGFGNTAPGTRADVFGLAQRGVKGTVAAGGSGNFSPRTGAAATSRLAYKKPDYAHALSRSDTDLLMLLFETYGGWSEPVVRLFRRMQDKRCGTS